MSDKKAILQAIAKEEALLSRLDREREQALSRLSAGSPRYRIQA